MGYTIRSTTLYRKPEGRKSCILTAIHDGQTEACLKQTGARKFKKVVTFPQVLYCSQGVRCGKWSLTEMHDKQAFRAASMVFGKFVFYLA